MVPHVFGNFAVPDAGKLIFDKMVGLVDGILKFISSGLFERFAAKAVLGVDGQCNLV